MSDKAMEYARLRLCEGLPPDEAADQAGYPGRAPERAEALYRSTLAELGRELSPSRRARPFLTGRHRKRLDELTAEDERWTTLAGYLYDPEATNGDVCPEPMVEWVAARYALTSRGRLFFLCVGGGVTERAHDRREQFDIRRGDHRWKPTVRGLMRRVFPEVLCGDYHHTDDPRDWMEHLGERVDPDGAPIKRRAATGGEIERYAHRFES